MLTHLTGVLHQAGREGRAAGGFTAYDLATGAGVLAAAESVRAPAVLIVSAQAFAEPTGPALVAGLTVLARRSTVPVAVQLDHVADLGAIAEALEAGITAVMADGSKLPFGDNVALVRAAVELAAPRGAQVEAELGRIEGDEETSRGASAAGLTDPTEAARFIADTRADCLAVSIGNVHGAYREPPALDWPRLAAIRAATSCPLSLHGASGLPVRDLRRAVAAGVAKVNVNTELRERWLALVARHAVDYSEGARLLALQRALAATAADVAAGKLSALTSRPEGTAS